MALIPAVVEVVNGREKIYKWEGVGESDTCAPVCMHPFDDMTLKCVGTFGSTALSIALHGSDEKDGGTSGLYTPLTDTSGTVIAIDSAGGAVVGPNMRWYKPVISAGDSTSDVDIYLKGV